MVFTVRCFKCGEQAVRLVLGGRAILHARCQACSANLLAEVLAYEDALRRDRPVAGQDDPPTLDEIEVDPEMSDLAEETSEQVV